MTDLVQVKQLRVLARQSDGSETAIVKDIDFSIAKGEVLALIGESGSGKTTIALSLMGYARAGCRIAGGSVRVGGQELVGMDEAAWAPARPDRRLHRAKRRRRPSTPRAR
jgi:peptide/nickel transport system ATP-binding protein